MSRAADEMQGDTGDARLPGAMPPLSPRTPLLGWLLMAVTLVAVVIVGVGGPGPLDDPHEGDQRPGILAPADQARGLTGLRLPGDPIGRRPVVVVFERRPPDPPRLRAFLDEAPEDFATVLAVPERGARSPVPVVTDEGARLARRLGMPTPQDAGYPIGYALIDSEGRVRYATLDPTFLEHGFELATLSGALS